MWKHATDFPPKASLWQLSQQYSPKAAVGLQAETTAVTASHGSFLSEVFPLMYGVRLGETEYRLKKERFRLCMRKPFFCGQWLTGAGWCSELFCSHHLWWFPSPQKAIRNLLGSCTWSCLEQETGLQTSCGSFYPEPSCDLMNAFSCPGLALLSKVVDYLPAVINLEQPSFLLKTGTKPAECYTHELPALIHWWLPSVVA